MIICVPVFFADRKKVLKVEVQIRTIAMDFWASLEHQLKYKQAVPNQQDIVEELKNCADLIHATDEKMLASKLKAQQMQKRKTTSCLRSLGSWTLQSIKLQRRAEKIC